MKQGKVLKSIKEAVEKTGLQDGMTISFHHHLRNGDYVLNMVLEVIEELGIRDLNVNASSLFDIHEPLIDHIVNHTVTGIETNYISGGIGERITEGILDKPVIFHTHGGRPAELERGNSHIDVAFIAAPVADRMGNCTGKEGKSACGSLGYAMADAMYADKVVVITDDLREDPLGEISIPEIYVDYVVAVDRIGDPKGIVSGTTQITRDPISLVIAELAAKVIQSSGLLKDGFSFQTGAGGASLATAKYLKEIMVKEQIQGSFGMGGITAYLVDMLESGCFKTLYDVQCFDIAAIESLKRNANHVEVSASHYASPAAKSALVDSLDVVILGATEIDVDFNVNVHTDSNGYIMGGSGGHSDTAAGAKLAMIVAPLIRARMPIVVDKVMAVSTPGNTVDVLVTQYGVAVNPLRKDLKDRLKNAGIPLIDIHQLKEMGERLSGIPQKIKREEKVVAQIMYRDGQIIDSIYQVKK